MRTRYSSLDMVRMAKFAKENPDLKPIPLIQQYNAEYPEVTTEQKLTNVRNWLHDSDVMEDVNKRICDNYCKCKHPKPGYPEMVFCDNCGLVIKEN